MTHLLLLAAAALALSLALDAKRAAMNQEELAELRQAIARRRAGGGVVVQPTVDRADENKKMERHPG